MRWQDSLKNSLQHFVSSYLFERNVSGLGLTNIQNLAASIFISWYCDSPIDRGNLRRGHAFVLFLAFIALHQRDIGD
jgi:hypothetical protein